MKTTNDQNEVTFIKIDALHYLIVEDSIGGGCFVQVFHSSSHVMLLFISMYSCNTIRAKSKLD